MTDKKNNKNMSVILPSSGLGTGLGGGHTTSRNNGFHEGSQQGQNGPPGPGHRETGIIEKLLVKLFILHTSMALIIEILS